MEEILVTLYDMKKQMTTLTSPSALFYFLLFCCRTSAFSVLEKEIAILKLRAYEMSEEENRMVTMKQLRRLIEILKQSPAAETASLLHALLMYDRSCSMRLYVHWNLFCETIRTQGTEEQASVGHQHFGAGGQ